jgi:hypothetical protein
MKWLAEIVEIPVGPPLKDLAIRGRVRVGNTSKVPAGDGKTISTTIL